MKATLKLLLSDAWVSEPNYAEALQSAIDRLKQLAFVDFGERRRNGANYELEATATFDYWDEVSYAEKLTELMEYAREYYAATLIGLVRGEGIAAEGHLDVPDNPLPAARPQAGAPVAKCRFHYQGTVAGAYCGNPADPRTGRCPRHADERIRA